jgi:hypothetical protein
MNLMSVQLSSVLKTVPNLGLLLRLKSKPKLCYGRRSVGQPVLLSGTHLGPMTRFLLLSDRCGCVDVGRVKGAVAHNCYCASPAQSFSGLSPARLVTIFYCLKFKTPKTWKARSPYLHLPAIGWPIYVPRHWVPFTSPLTTHRATVEVFGSPPHRFAFMLWVGVLLAADSQSTSSSGYRAILWDPWPDFSLLYFLHLTITFFFFLRRLLWQKNGSVVYSAITHYSGY